MNIAIIGTGYVGLVTGACFAEVGHNVICVDCDEAKVKLLQGGGIPIFEPGLEEMVKKNVAEGRLTFTASTAEGVEKSDVVFIAVPTPPLDDGSVDLSFIERVARDIADATTTYKVVVDKSTVPVKTGEKVAETINRYCKSDCDFDVVSNPEFLREGFAVEDLMNPDRIVVGTRSDKPVAAMREIYEPFNAPIIFTDINSAELIKHAANSFLAMKISYINAVASHLRGDWRERRGSGKWDRHGRAHWPQVPQRVAWLWRELFPERLERVHPHQRRPWLRFWVAERSARRLTQRQMDRFLKKITDTLWILKDKTIGVLGLAFKQNTDDVRMSPAIEVCQRLLKGGAILRVHDPKAMEKARELLPAEGVTYVDDMDSVADGCDALVVATEWPQFKELDLVKARDAMTSPILFDGRNLFDPAEMEQLGFTYKSIGR